MSIPRISFLIALAICFSLAACAAPAPLPPSASPALTSAPVPERLTPTIVAAPTAAPTQQATSLPTVAPSATPTLRPPAATATSASRSTPALVFDSSRLKTEVDAQMASFMKEQSLVACSVAVVYPDAASSTLQKQFFNYGTLSRESKTPVDSTTLFEIGSVTKLFTADLLSMYVREGRMKLGDPLQKYLPSNVRVPTFNGQPITLGELATHTSALPRVVDNVTRTRIVGGVQIWGYVSNEEIFQFLDGFHLPRAPGSQWEYSNLAFGLLGIAEEYVGGASYADLVQSKIAGPLGLNDTRIVLSPAQQARLAQAYSAGKKGPPVASAGGALAAGALRSTTQDMAAYLVANITPDQTPLGLALSDTQVQHARGPNANTVAGLGWNITNPADPREELSKDGATAGYGAFIAFSKTNHDGFTIMCNGQNVSKSVPAMLNLLGAAEVPIDDAE